MGAQDHFVNRKTDRTEAGGENADGNSDDDIRLAPVQCASRDQYEAAQRGWKSKLLREAAPPAAKNLAGNWQFSLQQLLVLTTLAAVGLGGGALLTPKLFALVCGVVAVVSAVAANFQERSVSRSICLMSVLVYLIAAATAAARTLWIE